MVWNLLSHTALCLTTIGMQITMTLIYTANYLGFFLTLVSFRTPSCTLQHGDTLSLSSPLLYKPTREPNSFLLPWRSRMAVDGIHYMRQSGVAILKTLFSCSRSVWRITLKHLSLQTVVNYMYTLHIKLPHSTELLLKVCECLKHILFPLCSELLQTAH